MAHAHCYIKKKKRSSHILILFVGLPSNQNFIHSTSLHCNLLITFSIATSLLQASTVFSPQYYPHFFKTAIYGLGFIIHQTDRDGHLFVSNSGDTLLFSWPIHEL